MAQTLNLGALSVSSGPDAGKRYPVADGLVFGRDAACSACLSDQSMSRKHFRLRVRQDEVEIEDSGSSNGTKVNGRHVSVAVLRIGDRIEAGDTVLTYEAAGMRRRMPRKLLYGTLVLVTAVAGWVWISGDADARRRAEIRRHKAWAAEFEKQRNYGEALYEYRVLAKLQPRGGYGRQVEAMARLEQRDEALNRVGAAARVGDFDRAGRVLDSLQAASPDDEEVRRVAAQLAQGRDFFAAVSRANALRQEQKYDQAVAVLDSFAQSAPDQSVRAEVARVLLGKAYYLTNQGSIAAGRQALAVVLERDPGNAEAIRALADLQEITSRPPVPRRRAAPIERRRPEPSPYASPAPAAPVTPAVEEPAVAETGSGDTAQARILWEEGYKMLSEYSDTNAAESRWSGARQLAPAGSKYHQKATEWLKRIGRL